MTPILIAGALSAGIALGLFFFGALWLTVLQVSKVRYPALLALSSFWIRSGLVIGSALAFVRQRWEYGLILAAGFALGRLAISWILRERRLPKCT